MKYFIFVLMGISAGVNAESYLCTESSQVGFVFEESKKDWIHSTFPGNAYVVKETGDELGVFNTGGELLFKCEHWFRDIGVAHCGDKNSYHFKFFRTGQGGKFIASDLGVGYLFDNKSAAPRVGVGKCISI
ncbi:hypothetical protein ACJO15_23425 [Vibrio parahaemolyticus]|uniref:hypothetical protein n=1 Tax=Vibrio parahaemolyticus TaxID=670 RepID=UPI0004030DC3|nr:hypothetical protein [Vibrio parahaemolyticus]MBE4471982.1 hypothetical protein [Vibrio parahaemolyticus]MDG2784055.1 hypothetical protein [Vibrio parahaemolyticus]MEA5296400.1 hypothetical protein [Vibrio parahaemolyticus]HCG5966423.1 hypothetical protein [Vibrio parahaemolyticus]HCH4904118.1 hypothetical protein [Vibrio parahaemolyticus]